MLVGVKYALEEASGEGPYLVTQDEGFWRPFLAIFQYWILGYLGDIPDMAKRPESTILARLGPSGPGLASLPK